MNIQRTDEAITNISADAVVFGIWQGEPLSGPAQQLDQASGGLINRLLERDEIDAKLLAVQQILAVPGIQARSAVVVGLGERGKADAALASRAAGAAARWLAKRKRESVAWYLEVTPRELAISGAMVGCVGQDLYRKEKSSHWIGNQFWFGVDAESLSRGRVLGQCTNLARQWVNQPANEIYPESFAKICADIGRETGLKVEVWDERRLEAERCQSLLAVGRASDRPPRLVIIRHEGRSAKAPTLGLVGKGVTFDSGGLSIKPTEAMSDMKCDMSGAASVLAAMRAIALLKLPVNVIGLVGLVENMISGRAMKLGDVVTARNGTTIEVLNTDAEGRMVLADVLDVAVEEGATCLVDLATLTGACMVALGRWVAGVMTNDQSWCDQVMAAASRSGEPVWQLPMFDAYQEDIRSEVADIKNIGDGRWGGAITAAKFLQQFVGALPWVHIDIAGPSFSEKPRAWIDAGASGCMVPTLVELARSQVE